MIQNHLCHLGKSLEELCKIYDNLILMGDAMNEFCCVDNLSSLVKKPTCFKNPIHPSCIDLILTNKSASFQNNMVAETGLSDFHQLTITVMKCSFQKQSPKVIYYRNYKCFDNIAFKASLCKNLSVCGFRNINCDDFENLFLSTFNEHTLVKKRYIRANNAPFMNKELYKAIMTRSRLRNRYLKLKTNKRGIQKTKKLLCNVAKKY